MDYQRIANILTHKFYETAKNDNIIDELPYFFHLYDIYTNIYANVLEYFFGLPNNNGIFTSKPLLKTYE